MRASFTMTMLSLLAACGADGTGRAGDEAPLEATERASEGAKSELSLPAPELKPLAELSVQGHTISFYDEGDGTLGVAERSAIGETPLLSNLRPGSTPSEVYAQLGVSPVPESVLEYERSHGMHASLDVEKNDESEDMLAGLPVLRHEAGAQHFDEAHCPQAPYDPVWSGFRYQYERDNARYHTHIVTRRFCYSAGHVGGFEQRADASVMSNAVAAVRGDVCFTRTKDTGSASWTIFEGEQLNYNTLNRPAMWETPCSVSGVGGCSASFSSVVAPMTASVGCAEAGDEWRWGGIFVKTDLTKFWQWY